MAAIDLQDAYYSIPFRSLDGKFLRFIWEGTSYEFTCLPNGLSCAPRIFTKILKPPLSCRTSWWHLLARTNLWPMCQKCYRHHCIVWQIRVGCTSREVCFHTHPSPHDPGVCIKFSNNDTSAYQGNALTVPSLPSPSFLFPVSLTLNTDQQCTCASHVTPLFRTDNALINWNPDPPPHPGPRWGFDLTSLQILANSHPTGAYLLVKPPPG